MKLCCLQLKWVWCKYKLNMCFLSHHASDATGIMATSPETGSNGDSSPGRVSGTHNQGDSLDNSARWEHYGSWLLIEHYNTQYCFKIRNTRCSYNFQLELRRRLQNTVDHLRVIIFVFRFVQAKACLLIYIYVCVCVLYIRASTWCTFSAMTKIKMLNLMCQDASLRALLL